VADERERQDALELGLRERAEDADDHRRERDDQQQRVDVVVPEDLRLGADHRVDADLRQQAREDRGDGRRRGRVRVGQPERQREHGRLDAEGEQQHEVQDELRRIGKLVIRSASCAMFTVPSAP
jgi:hypothetical protein